jgi:signal transduction histidine kinase
LASLRSSSQKSSGSAPSQSSTPNQVDFEQGPIDQNPLKQSPDVSAGLYPNREGSRLSRFYLILALLVSCIVCILDILTPLGFAAPVLQIGSLWLASLSKSQKALLWVTALTTVFTVLGFFISDATGALYLAGWFNHFLCLFVLWASFAFLSQQLKFEKQIIFGAYNTKALIESIPSPVFLLDKAFTIKLANRVARELLEDLSLEGEEIDFTELLFQAEGLEELPQRLLAYQRNRTSIGIVEMDFPGIGHFLMHSQQFTVETEQDLIIKLTDVTKLKETLDRLENSNSELRQFAHVASHDLQEPLRKIVSFLQILEQDHAPDLNDDAKECISISVDGAKRLQVLIDDLLSFSGLVESKALKVESVDCQQLVSDICDSLSVKIQEKEAVIEYEMLPTVWGVRSQLQQLFQNLISNSLKYSRNGVPPKIKIQGEKRGKIYKFSVSDNGIGIAPEFQERVFTIFQRLHSRNEYSGTGIGLAICKKIVHNHNGSIWLRSTPGKGSEFFFNLRRYDDVR